MALKLTQNHIKYIKLALIYLLNANWVLFSAQIQTTFEEVENWTALNTFEQLFLNKTFKKERQRHLCCLYFYFTLVRFSPNTGILNCNLKTKATLMCFQCTILLIVEYNFSFLMNLYAK